MQTSEIHSRCEWLGGIDALNRLTTRFYEHVHQDEPLKPVFAYLGAEQVEGRGEAKGPYAG